MFLRVATGNTLTSRKAQRAASKALAIAARDYDVMKTKNTVERNMLAGGLGWTTTFFSSDVCGPNVHPLTALSTDSSYNCSYREFP